VVALVELGAILEGSNLHRARDIRGEKQPSAAALDATLIEMEQAIVESVLLGWAQSGAWRYRNFILELDRVLHAAATRLPIRSSVSVRRYARVLRLLTATLGRSLSFGSQGDRIRIGQALIEEARDSWPVSSRGERFGGYFSFLT
jgi:hypothetical protein